MLYKLAYARRVDILVRKLWDDIFLMKYDKSERMIRMKKKVILLFFLWCADAMIFPPLYAHSILDELNEQVDNEKPVLDLDDSAILSDDEDLLIILGEPMEKPSALWSWFCTVGTTIAVHCIHAQRYMGRLMERITCWFKGRKYENKGIK